MTTKFDTNWIMKTAQGMYEVAIKYNSRFTLARAINMATERAKKLNEALQNMNCKINEHDNITRSYDFSSVQSLDSVYGCRAYCGD